MASATANTVKQQAVQLGNLVAPDGPEGPAGEEKEKEIDQVQKSEETSKSAEVEEDDGGFNLGWMKSLVNTVKNLAMEDTTTGEKDIEVPVTADLHAFDSAASVSAMLITLYFDTREVSILIEMEESFLNQA